MPRYLAFIELHSLLFVLHRLQQFPGLFLTHLAWRRRFGFHRRLRVFRRTLLRLFAVRAFYLSGFWLTR